MTLPPIIWVGLARLFLLAWWVVEDFILGLESNVFLYPYSPKALDRVTWSEHFYIPLMTAKISLGIKELSLNFMRNLSGRSTFLVERHLMFIKTLVLSWSSSLDIEYKLHMESRFLMEFTFVHHNQDSIHSWSSILNMNMKILERSCKDTSRTFFDEFSSFKIIVKPNWFAERRMQRWLKLIPPRKRDSVRR